MSKSGYLLLFGWCLFVSVASGFFTLQFIESHMGTLPKNHISSISYVLKYDTDSGNYYLHDSQNSSISDLIASSPEDLEKYMNKSVEIEGNYVWTKDPLRVAGYAPQHYEHSVVGVAINKISFTD